MYSMKSACQSVRVGQSDGRMDGWMVGWLVGWLVG